MSESTIERLAPLSGLVAVVLVGASAVVLGQWEYLPAASDLQSFYAENSSKVVVAGQLGVVAGFALMWFAGSVRRHLSAAEGTDGRLAALGFGGTLAAGALLAAGYSMVMAAGARGGATGGIGADAAAAMYDLYATLVASGVGACLAVLLLAAGLVGLRHAGLPHWLSWAAVVFAVGSLTPASYIFLGLDLIWIAVVSVRIYMAAPGASAARSSSAAAAT